MKQMGKYFLAIVPEGPIQQKAQELKLEVREKFNVKYALKSPAHVTLKMPFVYNEAKEAVLIRALETFLAFQSPLDIKIEGVRTFGHRVIFWNILADESLYNLQAALKIFCKRELKLVDELADRNFTPHMTIAFKDLKESKFRPILDLVKEKSISEKYAVSAIALLRREEGRWQVVKTMPLGLL